MKKKSDTSHPNGDAFHKPQQQQLVGRRQASTSLAMESSYLPESVYLSEGQFGPFQLVAKSGAATFYVDEPFDAGGLGSGPTPFDLLTASLGSCALMTMRLYAMDHGWRVAHMIVRVSHERSGLTARDRFVKEIRIDGDVTQAQRDALVDISTRCPIHLTLARGCDIETRMLVKNEVSDLAVTRASHMRRMIEACRS